MWYLPALEKALSPDDAEFLRAIRAPRVVAVQPEDSRRGLCVTPDGEIRHYGVTDKKKAFLNDGKRVYIASRDCGLSWKTFRADPSALGASARSPRSGRYVTVVSGDDGEGTFALWSDKGPDDAFPHRVKISERSYFDMFQPVALRSRDRWVCTMQRIGENGNIPAVAVSDDDGESWRVTELAQTPRFEVVWPHNGMRWENNGAEPVVTELRSGRLMLLARTSLDYFFVYYSDDGGDSWSGGERSRFHGTLTTPFLLTLHDGRTVAFWNNTQPLPELDHTKQLPPLGRDIVNGVWEDVFTNRDANHAAITSDGGETWRGFRELYLNDVRNASDFRVKGGIESSADKSVHQFQAIELPFNKILVAFGQHEVSRRTVIFDADWLLETSRTEDFSRGLDGVSTHSYVKSISGTAVGEGIPGHCAWNRVSGPLLVPDPAGTRRESLQLCRVRDPRLVSERQGVVWNFPAAARGRIALKLRADGAGVRVSVCDRWFNPIDETIPDFAAFTFRLGRDNLPEREWREITIEFDTESGRAEVYDGGRKLFAVLMKNPCENGASYLAVQSDASEPDAEGTYLGGMSFASDAR